jgi:hypothetical protein
VIHFDLPLASAIMPSSVVANFSVTQGKPVLTHQE